MTQVSEKTIKHDTSNGENNENCTSNWESN